MNSILASVNLAAAAPSSASPDKIETYKAALLKKLDVLKEKAEKKVKDRFSGIIERAAAPTTDPNQIRYEVKTITIDLLNLFRGKEKAKEYEFEPKDDVVWIHLISNIKKLESLTLQASDLRFKKFRQEIRGCKNIADFKKTIQNAKQFVDSFVEIMKRERKLPEVETPSPLKHPEAEKVEKEQKQLNEYLAYLNSHNPLSAELKNAPENLSLLASTLLNKNYPKDTIIHFETRKDEMRYWAVERQGKDVGIDEKHEKVYYTILYLDGKRQGKGSGLNTKQAFESVLREVKKNDLRNRNKFNQILSRVNKVEMPQALKSQLYRTQLARTLLDKGYSKDTIIQMETVYEDDIHYLFLTLDGKRFGPGGSPLQKDAFAQTLKKVKENNLSDREKFKQMLDQVEKAKLPESLRDPICRTWLARTLLDKGYAANVRLGILGEKTGELYALHIYINSKKCSGALAPTAKSAFILALEKLPVKEKS